MSVLNHQLLSSAGLSHKCSLPVAGALSGTKLNIKLMSVLSYQLLGLSNSACQAAAAVVCIVQQQPHFRHAACQVLHMCTLYVSCHAAAAATVADSLVIVQGEPTVHASLGCANVCSSSRCKQATVHVPLSTPQAAQQSTVQV